MSKYSNNKSPEERLALWYKDGLRRCCTCNQHKPPSEYHKDSTNKMDGLTYRCKVCACSEGSRHHKRRMLEDPRYKQSMAERWVKSSYGLTKQQYDAKLAAQDHKCAICSVTISGKVAHLDHSHATGKLRDFLCTNCNRGIGHLKESKQILLNSIAYLERHNDE